VTSLISRIFRSTTSESKPTNRPVDASPEPSLLNEAEAQTPQQPASATTETSGATPEVLSGTWTMEQVLRVYPSAQRDLFQQYHIGGCSSCGFQPEDTLAAVCVSHSLEVDEVVTFIEASQEVQRQLEVTPQVVAQQLKTGEVRLLDVRRPEEYAIAKIAESTLIDQDLAKEIIERWPKDTAIVTVCHHGIRSLDAAAYIKGHGFRNVKSMKGGIDAWSVQIDASVPRY
jgi:rhodanese-related sulfurtransferase